MSAERSIHLRYSFTMSNNWQTAEAAAKLSSLHSWMYPRANHGGAGGAYRDRTDDLKLAKLALYQLS